MKIEVNEKGSNNYYDEFLFLVSNHNKINSNDNIKIKKASSPVYLYLLISILFSIGFLIWFLYSKEVLHLCIMIFFILLSLLSCGLLILIKKRINFLSSNHRSNIFEISKSGVTVESSDKKYKLNFDEIKKVLIGQHTVTFVPTNNKEFITTRIEYKDEIVKTLKKYGKDNLLS